MRNKKRLYIVPKGQFDILDPVWFERKIHLKKNLFYAPALDNKVGITAMLTLAEKSKLENVVFIANSKEEISCGALYKYFKDLDPLLVVDIDSAYALTVQDKKSFIQRWVKELQFN